MNISNTITFQTFDELTYQIEQLVPYISIKYLERLEELKKQYISLLVKEDGAIYVPEYNNVLLEKLTIQIKELELEVQKYTTLSLREKELTIIKIHQKFIESKSYRFSYVYNYYLYAPKELDDLLRKIDALNPELQDKYLKRIEEIKEELDYFKKNNYKTFDRYLNLVCKIKVLELEIDKAIIQSQELENIYVKSIEYWPR